MFPVAEDTPAEAATLSSVIGNGLRWVKRKGNVGPGDAAVIIGPGAQGLSSTIVAREAGAYPLIVLGLARDAMRLDLAKVFGATDTVDVEALDP